MVAVHLIVLSAESSPLFQPSVLRVRGQTFLLYFPSHPQKIFGLMCVSKEVQITGEVFTKLG